MEALSNGDPFAWGLLGFGLVICGAVLVIRRQTWFLDGGAKTRQVVIAVLTALSVLVVIAAVVLQRVRQVGPITNGNW
ncbi:MAG: hypothetical protein HC853_07485 [Anaerolineae bacterium]|nr:hypothetical protein [Anaerolineae bacterium]